MNRIRLVSRSFKTLFVVMVVLSQGSDAFAKEKECWADFFEGTQYSGKHFLIEGSKKLESLTNVNGENWESRISSIKVGPKATITVFEFPNLKLKSTEVPMPADLQRSWGITEKDIKEDSELIFNVDSAVHDLSDFNFRQKIKSLKVDCK